MTTVQDLINLHKNAQKYEYASIRVIYADGHIEQHSNINNLVVNGDKISFTSTVDIRDIYHDSIPSVYEISGIGNVVRYTKRIL